MKPIKHKFFDVLVKPQVRIIPDNSWHSNSTRRKYCCYETSAGEIRNPLANGDSRTFYDGDFDFLLNVDDPRTVGVIQLDEPFIVNYWGDYPRIGTFYDLDGSVAFREAITIGFYSFVQFEDWYACGRTRDSDQVKYFTKKGLIFVNQRDVCDFETLPDEQRSLIEQRSEQYFGHMCSPAGKMKSRDKNSIMREWAQTAIQSAREGTLDHLIEALDTGFSEGYFESLLLERGRTE